MIRGQEKICELVDRTTLDDFPKTLMLVGPKGAGKHELIKYIQAHLNLMMLDITDNISLEIINQINERTQPYLYIIRVNELTIKEENTILKLLEEPLKNAYLILVTETDNGILPTILNRCQVWRLQNYPKDLLASFLSPGADARLLDIAETPGQLIELQTYNIEEMLNLIDKMIHKIGMATTPNVLTISNRVAFKNEKDKFDYRIFFATLREALNKAYVKEASPNLLSAYILTNNLIKHSKVSNVDVKLLFQKYLVELRALMRS